MEFFLHLFPSSGFIDEDGVLTLHLIWIPSKTFAAMGTLGFSLIGGCLPSAGAPAGDTIPCMSDCVVM